MEFQCNPVALSLHRRDEQLLAFRLQNRVFQQIRNRWGRRPKAVRKLARDFLFLRVSGYPRNPLVGSQTQVLALDVLRWDADIEPKVECAAEIRRSFFALQGGHGALEHLAVQVEADGV